jgi:hypothetical protein
MFVGMVLRGFRGVMRRMEPMAVSDMGVVRRLLVIAGFMVFGSFAMMNCCVFVVFCRLLVMLGAGMCTHTFHLSCDDVILGQSGESAVTVQFSLSKLTPDTLTAW